MKHITGLSFLLIICSSIYSQNWKEGLSRYTDGVETIQTNGVNDYVYAEHWSREKKSERSLVCWNQRKKILDLPYYNSHPEKKINGITKISQSIFAVYGDGNVTIVSLNDEGKVLHSVEEPKFNIVKGIGSLDQK